MVSMDEVKKEVVKLNSKKSSTYGAIPASILKQTIEVHLKYLTNTINNSLRDSTFSDELEQSEVPVYKNLDPLQKENYRPVSLLPHISKVFERVIYNQINSFMENKILKCVTGFRKSHGTQHSLIVMLEKWKKVLGKEENMSAIFMDLSKAFDTINRDLLLAKLKAYDFSKQALSFMCSYLKNRRQRVQINNKFSSLKEVIAGVPQVSINGPLLFNLFINDLFLFICFSTLTNYADDNNLFATGTDIQLINQMLLYDFRAVNNWFYENFMILNPGKYHFMSIGKDTRDEDVFYNNLTLKNNNEEEILGVTIDRKLTFHEHIKTLSIP